MEQPIDEIVLILGSDEVWFPTKKPFVEIKWFMSRGVMWSCTMRECNLNFTCEGERVCQIEKYFVIPVFKDPLSNLIDLFLRTCLVLKNKSIKLKVIKAVTNFKWFVFWVFVFLTNYILLCFDNLYVVNKTIFLYIYSRNFGI